MRRCRSCSSLWAEHVDQAGGDRPWADLEVSDRFAEALIARRRIQAEHILDRFPELADGKVLDYGSGQGAFVRAMSARGVDAWGCDIDLQAPGQSGSRDRLIELAAPWAVPPGPWHTISLLDVLEHHDEPARFLASMPSDQLLVKVPLATGPLAKAALIAAKAGQPRLLEGLFLVDDVSPHEVLLSARGLTALASRSSWRLVRSTRLPDVGRELPDRLRIGGPLSSAWLRPVAVAGGAALAGLARVWSDTAVFLFERAADPR